MIASFVKSQAAYAPEYSTTTEAETLEDVSGRAQALEDVGGRAQKRAVAFRRGCIAKCKNGKKSVRRAKKDFSADASFLEWIENDIPVMPVDKITEVLEVADMIGSHEHFPAVAIAEEPQGVTRGGSEGASSDSAEILSSEIARGGSEGASSNSAGISAEQLEECGMFDWHAMDVADSETIDLARMFPPGLADDDEEEERMPEPIETQPLRSGPPEPMELFYPDGRVEQSWVCERPNWNRLTTRHTQIDVACDGTGRQQE